MDLRRSPLPEEFRLIHRSHAIAWARPEAVCWVEEVLEGGGRLYDDARERTAGATRLQGRAPVYFLPSPPRDRVVRHYVRGGVVAKWLGDRYLRLGTPRPFMETIASEALRALDIPTPRVLAAVAYPSGPVYRGDLATEYIPNARDLADLLFGARTPPITDQDVRISALMQAGRMVARMATLGVLHPDLNLKNFLAEGGRPDSGSPLAHPKIHLLDLDRCRISPRSPGALGRAPGRWRMKRRLLRSLEAWESASGRSLPPLERVTLEKALAGDGKAEGEVPE